MNAGSRLDCQVLVVGAGPTGLVLAAELLARGIRTRLIDKGDRAATQSRAIGIHARTLEVLDMMGLAERFTGRGQMVREMRFYSGGRRLVSLEFARCGSRFGFLLDLPQDETERLLRARISELGGVVEQVLKLTHTLVRYGTMSHPVKRKVRDIAVPALGRAAVVQRRAARMLSQVSVAYPPGPLARPDRRPGGPRPGQRMPDIKVRAGRQATTLHSVLRDGRHVLVVPAAIAASVLDDARLRPYRRDLRVVTGDARPPRSGDGRPGLVVLVRPDGHVAARGWPGSMSAVTGYLRELLG
jgi:hypothetical protein